MRLNLCIGSECYQLEVRKTFSTASVSYEAHYEHLVTNPEDTGAELFELIKEQHQQQS